MDDLLNYKIKYIEENIVAILTNSELPISTLYYMMKSITSDLELNFQLLILEEQAKNNTPSTMNVPISNEEVKQENLQELKNIEHLKPKKEA